MLREFIRSVPDYRDPEVSPIDGSQRCIRRCLLWAYWPNHGTNGNPTGLASPPLSGSGQTPSINRSSDGSDVPTHKVDLSRSSRYYIPRNFFHSIPMV